MPRYATPGKLPLMLTVAVAWTVVQPTTAQTVARSNAKAGSWKLTVVPRDSERGGLIVAAITEAIAPGGYRWSAGSGAEKVEGSAQVFVDGDVSYLALNLPEGGGSSTRTLHLAPEASERGEPHGVVLSPDGTSVAIKIGGSLFTEYRTDQGPKPFLYPLIGPTGVSYTRSFPMKIVEGEKTDHPHQRSFWFTFGKVDGVDFWSEPKDKSNGTIRETGRKPLIQGPVLGRLHTTDDWLSPTGAKICEDERVLTVYHSRNNRILDFDVTIRANAGPVTFDDTKEGMFGIRVASSMDVSRKQGGKIVSSEGLTDEQAWGKPASWVDYSGPVDGKTVGIAVLNHPSSFRYPTTWHVRTYGLFAANPFGWRDFGKGETGRYTISQGKEIQFRYRVILHAGDAASAQIDREFQSYAQPPHVELTAE